MSRSPIRHAVVIGASMAGLTAARVLADHAGTVTVLDRDDLPSGYDPRKGVPQGRHAHALLGGGARAIEGLFPGIMEEMVGDDAGILDFNEGFWFQADGYRARSLVERKVISASRPFLEGHVRARVAALPNVTIRSRLSAARLPAGTSICSTRPASSCRRATSAKSMSVGSAWHAATGGAPI